MKECEENMSGHRKEQNQWLKGGEEEEIQTKGFDNLFNRIIAENFHNFESHPSAGTLENTKPSGPKKQTLPDTS
jgi:hypothetical protein